MSGLPWPPSTTACTTVFAGVEAVELVGDEARRRLAGGLLAVAHDDHRDRLADRLAGRLALLDAGASRICRPALSGVKRSVLRPGLDAAHEQREVGLVGRGRAHHLGLPHVHGLVEEERRDPDVGAQGLDGVDELPLRPADAARADGAGDVEDEDDVLRRQLQAVEVGDERARDVRRRLLVAVHRLLGDRDRLGVRVRRLLRGRRSVGPSSSHHAVHAAGRSRRPGP